MRFVIMYDAKMSIVYVTLGKYKTNIVTVVQHITREDENTKISVVVFLRRNVKMRPHTPNKMIL